MALRPEVKSGVEYALITLLIAGLCLWQLISTANIEPDAPAARLALLGLGLIVVSVMHCVFMMQIVRRTGRPFWPWFVAVVLFMPLGTAVLLALLLGEAETPES